MYGLNLLNTLVSCQWNSRRSLFAFSSLCFLWSFSKLSTFFKRYSINFNFATIKEWNHYQLVFLLYRHYPLYDKSINPLSWYQRCSPIRRSNESKFSGVIKHMYLVQKSSLSSFFLQLVSMGNHSALQALERAERFLASSLACYFSLHQC